MKLLLMLGLTVGSYLMFFTGSQPPNQNNQNSQHSQQTPQLPQIPQISQISQLSQLSQMPSSPDQMQDLLNRPNSPAAPTREQMEGIFFRRDLFCREVNEAKKSLNLETRESQVRFDLSTSQQKLEMLEPILRARGTPMPPELWKVLAIRGPDDIEFGSADGTIACFIPKSVGITVYSSE